jgi:hypothetical protein
MAMETIKSYTDIERSKVLAEILPLDSADYFYKYCIGHYNSIYYRLETYPYNKGANKNHDIPCWSLSALLSVLPKIYYPIKDHKTDLILGKPKDKWCVLYWDTTGMQHGEETLGDNPVDACYKMILRLKEKNLI